MIESKSVVTRIDDAADCLCVTKHGVREGMDEGHMILPTHLKQYCDPASLVAIIIRIAHFYSQRVLSGVASDR